MPTAHVNGADLAYELQGSGPRVLFLNGSGTTMASMQALISILGEGLELLTFDCRGLGASGVLHRRTRAGACCAARAPM